MPLVDFVSFVCSNDVISSVFTGQNKVFAVFLVFKRSKPLLPACDTSFESYFRYFFAVAFSFFVKTVYLFNTLRKILGQHQKCVGCNLLTYCNFLL